jgi:large subunit ribosomal protein L17
MRHHVAGKKFSRHSKHRELMFRNMLASLIEHERIKTTLPKAKELRSWADKIVTLGKKNTLHARRLAFALLRSEDSVKKLFDEIAPRMKDRQGGYTRIYRTGWRPGDMAPMSLIEFVALSEEKVIEKKTTMSKAKDVLKKVTSGGKAKKEAKAKTEKAEKAAKAKKPAKKKEPKAEAKTEA